MILAAAIELITVHMLDGRVVQLNEHEITQLVHASGKGNASFVEGVFCIVRLTDGTFVSVVETCETIEKAMEGEKP